MSSASADCEQLVPTDLLHANAGKYFRTARSNDLQIWSASGDGEQSVVTVSPPMVAMTQRGTSRRPKRKRTRSRLFVDGE